MIILKYYEDHKYSISRLITHKIIYCITTWKDYTIHKVLPYSPIASASLGYY